MVDNIGFKVKSLFITLVTVDDFQKHLNRAKIVNHPFGFYVNKVLLPYPNTFIIVPSRSNNSSFL